MHHIMVTNQQQKNDDWLKSLNPLDNVTYGYYIYYGLYGQIHKIYTLGELFTCVNIND